MNLLSIIKAMQSIGPIVAQLPEVKALVDTAIANLRPPDQELAQAAYGDLIADNDAGHARLQAKLAEAAAR